MSPAIEPPSSDREAQLARELAAARAELIAARDMLGAIRAGDVDALVVGGPEGDRVVALQSTDHPYRIFVERMDQAAVTMSADGAILYANPRFAALVGVPLEQAVGSSIYRFIPFKDVRVFDGIVASDGAGELSMWTTSGRLIPVRVAASRRLGSDRSAACLILTAAGGQPPQPALVDADGFIGALVDRAAESIVVCDAVGRIVRASDGVRGWASVDPVGQSVDEAIVLHVPESGRALGLAELVAQGASVPAREAVMIHPDGRRCPVRASLRPLAARDGAALGAVVTVTDLSDHRRAAAALQRAEAERRALFDRAGAGQAQVDPSTGRFLRANHKLCEMLGYTADELPALRLADLVHPDDRPDAADSLPLMVHDARPRQLRLLRKDGALLWVEVATTPVSEPDGTVVSIMAIVQDITERRQQEEAHRLRAHQLEQYNVVLLELARVVTSEPDEPTMWRTVLRTTAQSLRVDRAGIWLFDEHRSRIECLELYEQPSGTFSSGQTLRASDVPAYFAALEQERMIAAVDVAADPRTHEFAQALRALGVGALLDAPIRRHGRLVGVVCHRHVGGPRHWSIESQHFAASIADVVALALEAAERRRIERALRESEERFHQLADDVQRLNRDLAQRVAELEASTEAHQRAEEQLKASLREKEVLLKEIHHRVKNNLQIISSLLSLQSDALHDPDAVRLFQESQDRIRSMALVHERLYASDDLSRIDMRLYVSTLIEQLLSSYGSNPAVQAAVEAEPVWLDIDSAIPCGLIINELVSNAIKHAFPDGRAGRILIRLQPCGTGARLEVRDTGIGLPVDLRIERATTLGLRLVHALCEQLGADLRIDRQPGATFHIEFAASLHRERP